MTNPNINLDEVGIEARVDSLMQLSSVVSRFMEIKRATNRQGRPETDGEHTLHLQFIAVVYAAQYHPELDIGLVAVNGLVHDFVEVYAQDVNSLVATPEALATKALAEKASFLRLEKELGDAWPQFLQLIEDYESLATPEARFVKCLDKWDPSFTHYEDGGVALHAMGITERSAFMARCEDVKRRVSQYSGEFAGVLEVRDSLMTRVADVAYPPV